MDNSYFSTPPFWGGAEDYGSSKSPSLPLPRPRFRAPAFGNDRAAMVPVMDEEDALPSLPAPIEGPKPLAEPKTPSWTTADEIRETMKQQPKLERAKGWKGVLQAVGDVFVNPELMHPKYSQQVRDYEQKMGSLSALKKMEDQDAEAETRRLRAEAQMASDKSTEALRNRQLAKLDEPVQPKRLPPMNTSQGIYDPNTGEWIDNPNAPKKGPSFRREVVDDAGNVSIVEDDGRGGYRTVKVDAKGKSAKKAGGDGGGEKDRTTTFTAIQSAKAHALAAAEENANKALQKLRGDLRFFAAGRFTPAAKPMVDAIYSDLAKAKQQAQNNYEESISTVTGQGTPHFEYPAQTKPQPKAAAAAASPSTAQSPGKPVRVMDPKTGEVRSFQSLSAEEIADAKSKGYQVLD